MKTGHTRVVHMTSAHPADDVRIYHKQCRSLAAVGYEVYLVAPADGTARLTGVKHVAVPRPRNRFDRFTRTLWQVFRKALSVDGNVYHLHDADLIPAGFLLRLLGRQVVYDVHEDLPRAIQTKRWIPRRFRSVTGTLASLAEGAALRTFSALVPATPAIARRFPAARTALVQNFPLVGELELPDGTRYPNRPPVVAYVGAVSGIRGAREMVRAVSLLSPDSRAQLVLAGGTREPGLKEDLEAMASANTVRLLGPVSRPKVAELLGDARMGLVVFHPLPNHIEAQPNKLFEYMSAGIPVIASDFPLWRSIVAEVGCGILVDPLDPRAIADAMQYLLDHPAEAEEMGNRGLAAVRTRYNWEAEASNLLALYQKVLTT